MRPGARAAHVTAQAKINLVLRILAREASGYHSLETIFQRVDLADEVRVRITSNRTLDLAGPAMPPSGLGPVEKNLAWRAAVAYADATGWPNGFAIEVDKRIPAGGGLGGGSADAGAVLRALDALAPQPLGARLVEIAAPLGADVPFMAVEEPTALAWGRGERMLALPRLEPRQVLMLLPPFGVATADAYSWLSTSRGGYEPIGSLLCLGRPLSWDAIRTLATNDFERVVAARYPVIAELVDELASRRATIAMMSGSGSTVFGVFDAPVDAAALVRSTGVTALRTATSAEVAPVKLVEL